MLFRSGVEAAGIPHSAALGFYLKKPSVFVRKQVKEHGTKKMVEGGDVAGRKVLLIEDLVSLGKRLDLTKDTYSETMKKLHSGKGNLVSKAEKVKQLGSKTSKSMPQNLIDRTEDIGELFDTRHDS